MKNKSIVIYIINQLNEKETQYERLIKELDNTEPYQLMNITFTKKGNRIVEYEKFNNSDSLFFEDSTGVFNPTHNNRVDFIDIENICKSLDISYLYKDFTENQFYSFYIDNANHSIHSKDIRLLYFKKEKDLQGYINELGLEKIDTLYNNWKPLDWVFVINDNWLIKSSRKDNPMDFYLNQVNKFLIPRSSFRFYITFVF